MIDRTSALWAYDLGFEGHESPFHEFSEHWNYWFLGRWQQEFVFPRIPEQ